MNYEIDAKTTPGRELVALAEGMAADFALRAADHDRDGSYPHENLAALQDAGYLAAPVPRELGGMGVDSIHDILLASSRLARGDPSVTIGVNMHLIPVISMARRYRAAVAVGDDRRGRAFAESLERVARDGVVMAAAVSEPGQDLTRPGTIAQRTDAGWTINGRKIFCTMSPAATLLYTAVTFEDEDGAERYGYAQIPTETAGVVVHEDWNALGMRASGSHSVSFNEVTLPLPALRGGFPAGRLTMDFMERNLTGGAFHASASLGIAESAYRIAAEGLVRRNGKASGSARNQMLAAESAIELSAMRAVFGRAGTLIDGYYDAPGAVATTDAMAALFAEVQSAKTFIDEAAVRLVDRALALSGGAGYMSSHPLSRAYRDVRAGAFMHPLGANRAYEFIARVALGLEPALS